MFFYVVISLEELSFRRMSFTRRVVQRNVCLLFLLHEHTNAQINKNIVIFNIHYVGGIGFYFYFK